MSRRKQRSPYWLWKFLLLLVAVGGGSILFNSLNFRRSVCTSFPCSFADHSPTYGIGQYNTSIWKSGNLTSFPILFRFVDFFQSGNGSIFGRKASNVSLSSIGCSNTHNFVSNTSQRLIIAVTPTYVRAAQAPHFVQMANIIRVVPPPFLWIVVESLEKTEETALLLQRTAGSCVHVGTSSECSTINYTHIASGVKHENKAESRGVNQRNAALAYIEKKQISGLVFFMDDDNVYSPQLFQEIRKIKKVGIWPVGFLWSWSEQQTTSQNKKPMAERPIVRIGTAWPRVIGWETFEWAARSRPGRGRTYHTDMAGFAFNSEILWAPKNKFSGVPKHPVRFHSRSAWIETQFLERIIVSIAELEPLANFCQDVHVWHTKMEARKTEPYPLNWHLPQPTDLVPDENFSATPRYVMKQRGYRLANYSSKIPFGYRNASDSPRKVSESEGEDGITRR